MVKQAGCTPEAYANYLENDWMQGRELDRPVRRDAC
jgi:hypothetical protein